MMVLSTKVIRVINARVPTGNILSLGGWIRPLYYHLDIRPLGHHEGSSRPVTTISKTTASAHLHVGEQGCTPPTLTNFVEGPYVGHEADQLGGDPY